MISDFNAGLQLLSTAVANKDNDRLVEIFNDLELTALSVESFPRAFIDALGELICNHRFLSLPDSWRIVRFLQDNWSETTIEQREHLRPMLIASFGSYCDWMGAFITAELLGEGYGDANALETLRVLSRTTKSPERSAVPHGLEVMASGTRRGELREMAIAMLQSLSSSPIPEVRNEAELSLRRLEQQKTEL